MKRYALAVLTAVVTAFALGAQATLHAQVRPRYYVSFESAQPVTATASQNVGRSNIVYYATGVASGTTGTETAITLTKATDTGATSNAATFAIAAGKTFRITSIVFASRGNVTATAQVTTFSIRVNTAGAVTTTSTPIVLQARTATPATALAYDRVTFEPRDGYEIAGSATLQFGVTANAVFVTNAPTWDVTIIGQLY